MGFSGADAESGSGSGAALWQESGRKGDDAAALFGNRGKVWLEKMSKFSEVLAEDQTDAEIAPLVRNGLAPTAHPTIRKFRPSRVFSANCFRVFMVEARG